MIEARLRVVFDTNVYLAAAVNSSGPSELWLRIAGRRSRSFDLCTSEPILEEVARKLSSKFDRAPDQIASFIAGIREVAIMVRPTERVRVVERDPDDDMLFECALAAQAHLIVSADREILRIREFRGIGTAHPRELRNIFRQDLNRAA